tara:strand:- start:1476 stop:2144 length:669 start_codon:yes stop_codon:yes gene_type:complete
LAKRLSEKDKEEIVKFFTLGKTIDELSIEFSCTKLTISRNLKKCLGEKNYKESFYSLQPSKKVIDKQSETLREEKDNDLNNEKLNQGKKNNDKNEEVFSSLTPFIEIAPLNYEIENVTQKDFSSIPITEFQFPNSVYMIVDKRIELETKYLKDFPIWQFLSEDELNRKIIEIYEDLKIAKRLCNKDQKVIKVPNTEVFKIVAPILRFRGISRIVSSDKLIAI